MEILMERSLTHCSLMTDQTQHFA